MGDSGRIRIRTPRFGTRDLRSRGFGRFVVGFGLTLLGDQIWFVALAWAAASLPTSGETALVLAAGSVPRAALLLVGGALADRFGALTVALTSQAGRVLLMAGGATALFVVGEVDLWLLLVLAVVFGVLDAAHMPSAAALPPQILARNDLAAGQGIVQSLERGALVFGAPIGGLVVAFGGLTAAAVANAILFAVAFTVLRELRICLLIPPYADEGQASPAPVKSGHHESVWSVVTGGVRCAVNDKVLGAVLIVVTLLNAGLAGPLNVGLALLSAADGWSPQTYGMVLSAFAAGAVAGSLLIAAQRGHARPVTAALRWVALGSAALASVPFAPGPVGVAVAVALAGFAFGPGSALLVSVVQGRTPVDHLGRVMALVHFSAIGLTPVSYVAFGQLVELGSLTGTFTGFALTVLVTALAALALPRLRAVTR